MAQHTGTVTSPGRGRRGAVGWVLLAVALALPLKARCEWLAVMRNNVSRFGETKVAYTRNNDGYSLEIYRDASNTVYGRFILPGHLLILADDNCPTYQIDRGFPVNQSLNDTPCLMRSNWADFTLGYVNNNHIASSSLLAIMNGISIVFRFKLENGDYRRTEFSLQGSKRAMSSALGEDISIGPR
ncbi:MAG: hypothetical protein P8126_11530 [Gammaproteobacteria bacterium]